MRKSRAGRRSSFTPEVAERFCEAIAEGKTIRKACALPGMPDAKTIFKWLRECPEFLQQYARGREFGCDALFDEMREIADDASGDYSEDENGNPRFNGEHVQRSRLRIDTIKWQLSKLLPRRYGDKLDLSHGVQPSDPLASLIKAVQGTSIRPVSGVSSLVDVKLKEAPDVPHVVDPPSRLVARGNG